MVRDLEKTLWAAADKLRNNKDAAEYKHIALGLIFLKYISDSFKELHARLSADKLSNPEDKDEYLAENVFFVPTTARWEYLQHERAKLLANDFAVKPYPEDNGNFAIAAER
jgi:type I restriction enzyme M protein